MNSCVLKYIFLEGVEQFHKTLGEIAHQFNGKLVDNFSHESDVKSLQDSFTSRPYKTPSRHVPTRPLSIFTIVFPVKSQEAFSRVEKMANIRHGFGRECLLGFYGEHDSKNRKGSCRDVT